MDSSTYDFRNPFQLLIKYYFVNDFKQLVSVTNEIGDIYKATASKPAPKTDEPYQICDIYSKILKRLMIGFMVFYSMFLIVDSFFPLVFFILTGQNMATFGFEFPLVDKNTTVGVLLLLSYECFSLIPALAVFVAFDLTVITIFLNLSMTSKIIVANIQQLERDLETERVDARVAKRRLIDVMLMYQKYNR